MRNLSDIERIERRGIMEDIEDIFWAHIAHENGSTIFPEKEDIEAIRKIINYYTGENK